MSDNADLSISIGAKTDAASFSQARDAVKGVGEAFEKTFNQVERSKSLDNTARAFAQMAVSERDAANAAVKLVGELKEAGATDKEIEKTVKAFERQIDAIQKADKAAEKKAQNDAERFAEEEARLREEVNLRRLRADDANDRLDATRSGVGIAGDAASALNTIGGVTGIDVSAISGLLELTEALPILKVATEGLPATIQAAAQSLGLIKSAQDASTAATAAATAAEGAQTAVTTGLATASGGASVGIGAMLVSLAPFAAIGIAIAAAFAGLSAIMGALQARTAEATEALERQYDAQDTIDAFVAGGATVEQAIQRQTDLQNEAVTATNRFNEATKALADDFAERAAKNGDLVARLQDLFNIDSQEDTIKKRIEETGDKAKDTDAELAELNKRIDEGAFAADKAAKSTEKTTAATERATSQQTQTTVAAYQKQEQYLATHLANETGLKGQAYTQQIAMVAQAARFAAGGKTALNMSGASNSFKQGSFGGLRPIAVAPTVRREGNGKPVSIGNLNINTSANPQDTIKVLQDVGVIPQ